jgi:hypothetical protein
MELTGNYFADLKAAQSIGIVDQGKNPKKAELAKIVEEYNAQSAATDVGAESIPATEQCLIGSNAPSLSDTDLAAVDFSGVEKEFADRQSSKADAQSSKSQPKAQPIVVEWDEESEVLKQVFLATKDRVERSRIIYELTEKHGSKLVAEQLERTIAKIRAESRAYQYWLEDEKLQKAVANGMSWSKLIDNISSYKKNLNSYLNPVNNV